MSTADIHPLIVIDVRDREHLRYVVEVLRQAHHSWTNDVASQIEEQTKPPAPPLPTELGWHPNVSATGHRHGALRTSAGDYHWIVLTDSGAPRQFADDQVEVTKP